MPTLSKARIALGLLCLPLLYSQSSKRLIKIEDMHGFHDVRDLQISPDGKWVAYVSDSNGADEVWVRPFPGPGAPVPVSSAGGHDPVWSRDGKELFYQEGSKLMVGAVVSTSPLQMQAPKMLFDGGFITWEPNTPRTYDVAADGRFLMIEPSTANAQRFNVIINWAEELKRLVP